MRHITLKDLQKIRPMVAEEVNYILQWREANPKSLDAGTREAKLHEWEELLARIDAEIEYLKPVPRSKILPPGA